MSTDRYIERITTHESAVRRPVTVREVAALAGVSVSTVNSALAGQQSVSRESSARIRAAARRLGYQPSRAPRPPRTGLAHTMGLLVPDARNPVFTEMARGAEAVAQSLGWALYLSSSDLDEAREADYLDRLAGSADGILFCPTSNHTEQVQRLVDRGVAIVVCHERIAVTGAGGVFTDDVAGGRLAGSHLLARGARCVAMIGGPDGLATAREREAGLRAELQAAGRSLPPSRLITGPYTIEAGRWATDQLLAANPRIDAIFCASDLQAVGAAVALRHAGRAVPDAVQLCGFDGISWGELTRPALTTVARRPHRLGGQAAQLLVDVVGGAASPREIVLPVTLVERESSRRA